MIALQEKTKICRLCKTELPMTDQYFGKNPDLKDGLKNECKACTSTYLKKYRQENREHILETGQQYRQENKEIIRTKDKEYRDKNREHRREYAREYARKTKEVRHLYRKKYLLEHPEKPKTWKAIRKTRERKSLTEITNQQWEIKKEFFNYECAYCGNTARLQRDHFIPVSKGGGCTEVNIIPACDKCNSSKGANAPFEWFSKQEFYSKDREDKILINLGYKNN